MEGVNCERLFYISSTKTMKSYSAESYSGQANIWRSILTPLNFAHARMRFGNCEKPNKQKSLNTHRVQSTAATNMSKAYEKGITRQHAETSSSGDFPFVQPGVTHLSMFADVFSRTGREACFLFTFNRGVRKGSAQKALQCLTSNSHYWHGSQTTPLP